jgi:hypothetical protein
MHHPTPTDAAERTTRGLRQRSRLASAEALEAGDRFLGPGGRIWTVRTITTRGDRIVLTTPTPEGDSGAIVDRLAVARMIPLPVAPSSPHEVPARPGDWPTSWCHRDATDDEQRTQAIVQTAAGIAREVSSSHAVTA